MSHTTTATEAVGADIRRAVQLHILSAIWGGFTTLVSRIVAGYAERRRIDRAVVELSALSGRMLKDIGIERHDIERIVRNGRDAMDIRA